MQITLTYDDAFFIAGILKGRLHRLVESLHHFRNYDEALAFFNNAEDLRLYKDLMCQLYYADQAERIINGMLNDIKESFDNR